MEAVNGIEDTQDKAGKIYPCCLANYVMKDGTVRPFLIISIDSYGATGVVFFEGVADTINFPESLSHEMGNGVKNNCVAYGAAVTYEPPASEVGAVVIADPGTWHWNTRQTPIVLAERGASIPLPMLEAPNSSTDEEINQKLENFLTKVVAPRLEETVKAVHDALDSHSRMIGDIFGDPNSAKVDPSAKAGRIVEVAGDPASYSASEIKALADQQEKAKKP